MLTNAGIIGKDVRILSFGMPYSLIIFGLVYTNDEAANKNRIASFISESSFSIYLMHYQLVMVINSIGRRVGFADKKIVLMIISILTSIIIGVLCHLYIEKPLNTKIRRLLKMI